MNHTNHERQVGRMANSLAYAVKLNAKQKGNSGPRGGTEVW